MSLKELIKGDVEFEYYRDGNLWYLTGDKKFSFPVPIEDIGNATFLAKDKGILFMRYIRKHLDMLKEGNIE